MVIIDKDGENGVKLNYSPLMQGYSTCVIRNGILYTASRRNMQENIKKFDGERWTT